ncbi:MAG: hypothetical protein NTX59_11560 [Elusimicrobia bacterium]|nr:hypothetical protein [Elusimicrobiota bacterium]
MKHPRRSMKRYCYDYFGLRIRSEIEIPDWLPFRKDEELNFPDVVISLNIDAAAHLPESESRPVVDAQAYSFHIPGTGGYLVHHGREIVITPASSAQARELRLFLLGSAWGALCYQRGLLALHSSAVQVGDQAVVFCGEAGSGKSSAAAWLIARSHRFVGDDLCLFGVAAGQASVYPSSPRLKLWREALGALGLSDEGLERDHFRLDKFHLPRRSALTPLPVRAIYLLEWGEPGLRRLTGVDALRRFIISATYRGDLLEPMGQVAAHWERCAELARGVPVWVFSRPRDWPEMDAAMRLLQAHLRNSVRLRRKAGGICRTCGPRRRKIKSD